MWAVLFWLPSAVRERHLHTRFAELHTNVPLATASTDLTAVQGLSPADAVWWLHHHRNDEHIRHTLTALATVTSTPNEGTPPR
jgi:hypothetical protein